MASKTKRGFSLIELLTVLAIVAVVTAIAVPAYQVYATKTRLASIIPKMNSLKAAAQQYYEKNGSWPTTITALNLPNTDALDSDLITSFNVCAAGCFGAIGTNNYAGDFGFFLRLNPDLLNLPTAVTNPTLLFNAEVDNGSVIWYCTTDALIFSATQNIPAQYLPSGCVSPD